MHCGGAFDIVLPLLFPAQLAPLLGVEVFPADFFRGHEFRPCRPQRREQANVSRGGSIIAASAGGAALPRGASQLAWASVVPGRFDAHLEETLIHVDRLKQVFEILGEKPRGEECPAIEGIIDEAEELMDDIEQGNTIDAALIAAAQAVEHYEITRYGTLVSWAGEFGLDDVVDLLSETLKKNTLPI